MFYLTTCLPNLRQYFYKVYLDFTIKRLYCKTFCQYKKAKSYESVNKDNV